jgi:hypothetical protein
MTWKIWRIKVVLSYSDDPRMLPDTVKARNKAEAERKAGI